MSEEQPWTVGTLPEHEFGAVETLLARKGIAAPILTASFVDPDNRPLISFIDRIVGGARVAMVDRFRISQRIDHCLIGSLSPNAFAAAPAKGRYVIGFLIGAVSLLPTFDRLLRADQVRNHLDLQYDADIEIERHSRIIQEMLSAALAWITFHEIGHIKNGHLHHPEIVAALGAITELTATDASEDLNLTLHTLEMDADAFATARLVDGVILSWPNADNLLGASTNVRPSIRKLRFLIFAIYSMMRQFDIGSWTTKRLFAYSHPPAVVRMGCLNSLGYALCETNPQMEIDPKEWIHEGVPCTIIVEQALYGPQLSALADLPIFFEGGEWMQYTQKLHARWAKLRPDLEPYLLGGSLAPPQADPM